jgi:hypothetical protein
MQIVHTTYGVVNEFITDYYIQEDFQKQFEISNTYPAKLAAGLILRVKYVPFATLGVRDIVVNYTLHLVMV